MLTQLDGALATAERQYLGELVASHDGNEGIQAFIEKRSPTWRDC
jgi:enoyl-CoA hydratase/carnithine racemase